ncbi:MAG TPA: protein translocase subunit SecF, partial [Pirellulales bacterium]|jgi:SecD/SecF fusion protein|nr:protein translocase subunit SecF [Pirellulales bacterium]
MMQMMSKANYDFIGKRKVAIGLSVVVIAIGMVAVAARGEGLLDIDFTGGVSVETVFDKSHPQEVSEVRAKVRDLPDVTVQDVKLKEDSVPGTRFLIVTSEPDINKVEAELKRIFKGELAVNRMTISSVQPIGEGKAALGPPATGNQAALPLIPDENMLALADEPASQPKDADQSAAEKADATEPSDATTAGAKADSDKADSAKSDGDKSDGDKSDGAKSDGAKADAKKPPAESDEQAKPETSAGPALPAAAKQADDKPADEKPADEKSAGKLKADVFNPFAGGTSANLHFAVRIDHGTLLHLVRKELADDPKLADAAIDISNPEYVPENNPKYEDWQIKLAVPPERAKGLLTHVQQVLADSPFFPSSNKIGASVADNTQKQAIFALLASIILIALYVWFRFTQVMFGFAAILALVHDVLVTLGALAVSSYVADYLGFIGIEPFKINLPIIAAFLTIIGYSLNDTIVIFDRIREIRGKSTDLTPELVNTSINQTLSRTLLTSLTVFLVVLILYAIGGQAIHGFAFALVVGVISGTYSTVYIATPVLIWLNRSGAKTQRGSRAAA